MQLKVTYARDKESSEWARDFAKSSVEGVSLAFSLKLVTIPTKQIKGMLIKALY